MHSAHRSLLVSRQACVSHTAMESMLNAPFSGVHHLTTVSLFDHSQEVFRVNLAADADGDVLNHAAALAQHRRLHFHRFEVENQLSLVNDIALAYGDGDDEPRHWRGEVSGIAGLCLGAPNLARRARAVRHARRPGLAIQLEIDRYHAVIFGFA